MKTELSRTDVTGEIGNGPVKVPCLGCGKILWLFYNGGELDGTTHCGYTYALDAPVIELVVSKDAD